MTARTAGSTRARLWLPALVYAALVPTMFWLGMRSDPPERRAGAEPVIAGVLVSAPFLWLFLFAVACGSWAHLSEKPRRRRRALTALTLGAVAVSGLVVWTAGTSAVADGSAARAAATGLVVLAVLLPVTPSWLAHRQENRAPGTAG